MDVGGESMRPGARARRAGRGAAARGPGDRGPRRGRRARREISVDTSKLAVAAAALDAGATIVNDVTALRADPELAALVAERDADCCLVHMQGDPRTMQRDPRYGDVVGEVGAFLRERVRGRRRAPGSPRERILVDPGIGFGKTVEHNLELLARLDELAVLELPILIGTSRKSFLQAR